MSFYNAEQLTREFFQQNVYLTYIVLQMTTAVLVLAILTMLNYYKIKYFYPLQEIFFIH